MPMGRFCGNAWKSHPAPASGYSVFTGQAQHIYQVKFHQPFTVKVDYGFFPIKYLKSAPDK
jgi:hypothetical protein